MGLIADTLEKCREGDWDPLLLPPGMLISPTYQKPEASHPKLRLESFHSRSAAKKKTVGMPEFTKKDEFVKIYVNFSQNSLQKILFGI